MRDERIFEFEWSVVIGRFQPFHKAHHEILKVALTKGRKVVIILGSHNCAPDIVNPFSSEERKEIILSALSEDEKSRITFLPIGDYLYNENAWLVEATEKVSEVTEESKSICLVGHKSDVTSYYLESFPEWSSFDYSPNLPVHATKIRELFFTNNDEYKKHLHIDVVKWIESFKKTEKYSFLKDQFDELTEYREKTKFVGVNFQPTFVTVDCVVIKSAHILVVRRKGRYGKGLIALPGGFLDINETVAQSAIRELKEETAIALDKKELFAAIKEEKRFDHPRRSLRGRTITTAFCLDLGVGKLPRVKGSDDADKAWWMPLKEFYTKQDQFFEDHWHIVYYFTSKF